MTTRVFPNENAFKTAQSRRRDSKVSEMSPEARRAMLLAKEDTKENFLTISKPLQPSMHQRSANEQGDKKRDNLNSMKMDRRRDASREGPTGRRDSKPALRQVRGVQPTARSRSTLSHTDHNSDRIRRTSQVRNANYRDNGSGKNVNQTSGKSENNNGSHHMESLGDEVDYKSSYNATEADDWGADECLSVAASPGDPPNELSAPSAASFAAALHTALVSNGTERLRGDLTDNARISEPGTVRALNGGRLTNAQEVVVNVCHDDGKELIFHDDDEDSLETAKTISQIRINVWLSYNEKFEPECAYEQDENANFYESDSPSKTEDFKRSQTSVSTSGTQKNPPGRDSLKTRPPVARTGPNKSKLSPQRNRSAMPSTTKVGSSNLLKQKVKS